MKTAVTTSRRKVGTKLTSKEESKLHGWYTELWNDKMHKASEPGWCLTDALVELFGVSACRKVISKMPNNIGDR